MQTYGMHSIHGRAPAIATGLSTSRPDLSVWVVTGDGDALSIGGNHLIHALRRNVNVKILLFNNQIYGLTKGQYSPTSPLGTRNKSTPMGSLDWPFNPVSIALGAEATFVARSIDTDKKHLTEILRRAAAHKGSALIEIYQNCNVYNDGAFDAVKEQKENQIRLEHEQPIRFGAEGERGVKLRTDGSCELVDVADVGEDALLVHDEFHEEASLAFSLSRISHTPHGPTPIGIFRDIERPVYDELMAEQLETAKSRARRGRPEGAPPRRRHLDGLGTPPACSARLGHARRREDRLAEQTAARRKREREEADRAAARPRQRHSSQPSIRYRTTRRRR